MSDQALVPYIPKNRSDTVSLILRYTSGQLHPLLDIRMKPVGLEPTLAAYEIADSIIPLLRKALKEFFFRRKIVSEVWKLAIHLSSDGNAALACSIPLIPIANSCLEPCDRSMFNFYCGNTIEAITRRSEFRHCHFFHVYIR